MQYRYQVASDIIHDGLGVELTDEAGKVLADVFRCDADHSLNVGLFCDELPFLQIEKLIHMARQRLGSFEDGRPLPSPLEHNVDALMPGQRR